MTLRNCPPADQCSPEDLDAIADLVVNDPSASYDLAGSREHIKALCRRYQDLVQDRALQDSDAHVAHGLTIAALERALAAATNDLDSARTEIRALASTLDAERNERQGEVLAAEADRERADDAETSAELFETIARSMWKILERRVQTDPPSLAEIVRAVDGRLARALQRALADNAKLAEQLKRTAMLVEEQQQTRELDDQIDALRGNRESYRLADRRVEVRSCDLEIAEATRALAIINRRATEAEDQRAEQERTLTADDVRAVVREIVVLGLRGYDTSNCAARLDMAAFVANRVADKLAGRMVDPAQREADLREAFLAGCAHCSTARDDIDDDRNINAAVACGGGDAPESLVAVAGRLRH